MGSDTSSPMNITQNTSVVKEGVVQIQYGLKQNVKDYVIIVTNKEFLIKDITNKHTEKRIEWNKLLNIDHLNNQHSLYSFQLLFEDKLHPVMYIYCDSQSIKTEWIKVFEQSCSRFILTQELQSVKQCAQSLGFNKYQVEAALIKYHEQYGTVYNVDAFANMILNTNHDTDEISELKTDDVNIQCSICLNDYKNPVKNIHNRVYCFDCIQTWFDIINPNQTEITDPYTKQTLPQHCRLLIPFFTKMVEMWNYKQQNQSEQISETTYTQLKMIDEQLNIRREKILNHLNSAQNYQQISEQLMNGISHSDNFTCDEKPIQKMIDDAVNCHKYFSEIKDLIADGCNEYNDAVKRIVDNDKYLFKWQKPKWNHFIDKNAINWSEIYQIDDYTLNEIQQHTTDIIKSISKIIANNKLSTQQLKNEILNIILKKQSEIIESSTHELEEKIDDNIVKNGRKIKRILYTEHHGLVNTNCLREIADCIRARKPFELYHNDLHQKYGKSMNRDKLVRFLETAGMDGSKYYRYVYKSASIALKERLFRLSTYLKTLNDNELDYFPYFKYLKSINISEQPIIEQQKWTKDNDKIELKIKFDCDYDTRLKACDNDENNLCEEIKKQLAKHLKLDKRCLEHVVIKNPRKGSIIVVLVIYVALIVAAYGMYDLYSVIAQNQVAPGFRASMAKVISSGICVGGGMAAIVAVGFGLSAFATLGVSIIGVIIGAAVGYCIYKLKNGPEVGDYQLGVEMGDMEHRIEQDDEKQLEPDVSNEMEVKNNEDSTEQVNGEQYSMRLICGCLVDYVETEGGYKYCPTHEKISCVDEIVGYIDGSNTNLRQASYSVMFMPGSTMDCFGV